MSYRSKIHHVKYTLCFGGDVECEFCYGKGKIAGIYAPPGQPPKGSLQVCPKCEGKGLVSKYCIKKMRHFNDEKKLDDFIFRLHKIKMKLAFRSVGLCYTSSLDCWEKMRRQRLPYGERRVTEAGAKVSSRIQNEWTTKLTVDITHT